MIRVRSFQTLSLVATLTGLAMLSSTAPLTTARMLADEPRNVPSPTIHAAYGNLPLSFEANLGQTDPQVRFLSRGKGYSLFLTSTEAVLALKQAEVQVQVEAEGHYILGQTKQKEPTKQAVLRMKLLGANPKPKVTGLDALPGRANYFVGNNPKQWRTNVPTYAKVRYEQIYPGVDLIYYGNQLQLEYDLVVAPGADLKQIQLAFGGADDLEVGAQGDLVLHVTGGDVRLHKPVIYQEYDGVKQQIPGRYVLNGPQQVSFQVAAYDASRPLIIDPVLSYSTYLGGSSEDIGNGIAVDTAGNAYVTGWTVSPNFPTANPFQPYDSSTGAFVTKLNSTGTGLVYSTYLTGSRESSGQGIAVDASGSAYVTGFTSSLDFPVKNSFQSVSAGSAEAFVTKLAPSGDTLIYSTYLGGSNDDLGRSIAVDGQGYAYVTGSTRSFNFPAAQALQPAKSGASATVDVFMAKLDVSGSALLYSTYLGGSSDDFVHGISADSVGHAYVTGTTYSTDFPTSHALQPISGGNYFDAFVTKLAPEGTTFIYSTYLGGEGGDEGLAITADGNGNAYVTGWTNSPDFPLVNPLQPMKAGSYGADAFVTKINPAGSSFSYSTYFGGGKDTDQGTAIAVDAAGRAYIAGRTYSSDFPAVRPLGPFKGGGADAFVAKLIPTGDALVYSTPLGGQAGDYASAIAVDNLGNAYITGETESADFPTANAFQASYSSGAGDAFVAKLSDDSPDPAPMSRPSSGRVEQNDPAVGFGGAWYTDTATGHSGGSAAFAEARKSRAVLTFSGTGVSWIGSRDQWSGIASVYLDNAFQGNVDTYSLENHYQTELFAMTGLTAGTHTVVIEATGTHGPLSSQAWIWVDAFDVVGTGPPPPTDSTPPTVTMTAPANGAIVSGTVTVSADASDNIGVAGVQFKLDGAPLGAEDTEAPYSVTWNTSGTIVGVHKLKAVARDAAGNSSTSAPVTVTVANVVPSLPRLP